MGTPGHEDRRIATARAILADYTVAHVDHTSRRDLLHALARMESATRMLLDFADSHVDLTPER